MKAIHLCFVAVSLFAACKGAPASQLNAESSKCGGSNADKEYDDKRVALVSAIASYEAKAVAATSPDETSASVDPVAAESLALAGDESIPALPASLAKLEQDATAAGLKTIDPGQCDQLSGPVTECQAVVNAWNDLRQVSDSTAPIAGAKCSTVADSSGKDKDQGIPGVTVPGQEPGNSASEDQASVIGNVMDLKDLLTGQIATLGLGKLVEWVTVSGDQMVVAGWTKEFRTSLDELSAFRCADGTVLDPVRSQSYASVTARKVAEAYAADAGIVLTVFSHVTLNGDPTPNLRGAMLMGIATEIRADIKEGHLQNVVCVKPSEASQPAGHPASVAGYEGRSVAFDVEAFNVWCTYMDGSKYKILRYWATYGATDFKFQYQIDGYINENSFQLTFPRGEIDAYADELMVDSMSPERFASFIAKTLNVEARSNWRVKSCEAR